MTFKFKESITKMNDTPCYKCPARKSACWDTCIIYIAWKEKRIKLKAIEDKQRDLDFYLRNSLKKHNHTK